ncbi:MAG TPA: hypothetical protein DEQ34_03270 [Balneolaceae bacterium]|nr:hypothetical protein [Balneolaceae bacterium]|tara:strand:- start:34377 stop:36674 length:2298 start_codon:yes stop_codon:yes gene_type:complete
MRNFKLLTVWLLVGFTIFGCEIPKQPNFKTSNKVEVPLLYDKEFQFLGGGGDIDALIDTTKSLDSLFTVVNDGPNAGLIKISKEEEFEFGDLNDAIPEIDAEGTSFTSEVGELEVGSFSSGNGNLGTANFQDLTGLNPSFVPAGTPIPGGSTPAPVNIGVGNNTDFFVSATIKSGGIQLTVTNNLGFDIDVIGVDVKAGSNVLGTLNLNNANHGSTVSDILTFNQGDQLIDLNVDVSVSWSAQTTSAEPGELVVEGIEGQDLVASQVTAALEGQDFSTSNTTSFSDSEFKFTEADHYVELESGTIQIAPIQNGLDLDIDTLKISFPNILKAPYTPADSLVIRYVDSTALGGQDARILRNSSSTEKNISLEDVRLYALNNEITYNIFAVTENTQNAPAGDQNRVINENQEIAASVDIAGLKVRTAFGEVVPQTVLLGDDDPSNGDNVIDLFNETEAEITEIDGIEDLSDQVDGLEFTNAQLTITYETNIDIPTTIYAAILGVNGEGEEVYLTGRTGSDYIVTDQTKIDSLYNNGQPISVDQAVKFSIDPGPDGTGAIIFDSTTTNVNEFLNNLPSDIRFIGMAVVNESGEEAMVSTPLEFNPKFNVDLPLAFQTTTAATYTDTTETDDLSDLPSPLKGDDQRVTSMELIINYENGLPLAFGLEITFLDGLGSEIVSIPYSTDDPIELGAATVDEITRFASVANTNSAIISITDQDDLDQLYKTRSVIINATLNTTSNSEVKLRATDKIKLSVSAKIAAEVTINTEK